MDKRDLEIIEESLKSEAKRSSETELAALGLLQYLSFDEFSAVWQIDIKSENNVHLTSIYLSTRVLKLKSKLLKAEHTAGQLHPPAVF